MTDGSGSDEALSVASRRDAVMVRLLDTCIRLLADQGMEKLFVDAIQGGDEGLRSMGTSRGNGAFDGRPLINSQVFESGRVIGMYGRMSREARLTGVLGHIPNANRGAIAACPLISPHE